MSEIAYFLLGDFPCSIWEHDTLGHLCGYLGVPPIHPWYRKDQGDLSSLDVHGGITLACHEKSSRQMSPEYREAMLEDIRPLPEFKWVSVPNKDGASWPHDTGQDVWWVGFDCGHYWDTVPGRGSEFDAPGASYKDKAYVHRELEGLARQAADMMREPAGKGTA